MTKPIEILLVEDNRGDARLTEEALRENAIDCCLHVTPDGLQALDYLHRRGVYADVTEPDLILLDLNLPKRSGTNVLAEIHADPHLARIPVVVLTTSNCASDIARSSELGAVRFITKPIEFDVFIEVIRDIEQLWKG